MLERRKMRRILGAANWKKTQLRRDMQQRSIATTTAANNGTVVFPFSSFDSLLYNPFCSFVAGFDRFTW